VPAAVLAAGQWKNERARRGASNIRAREVSTWRIDSSHQQPAAHSVSGWAVGVQIDLVPLPA